MKEIQIVDMPDVSIVVPMYNAEKFVAQTLNSLLNQTYRNFEILVVDDGSTDQSKAVVEKFFFDRRLKYYYKLNGGTGSALNFGHHRAIGKFVTWCAADNVYYPEFLKTLREGLVYAESQGFNSQLVYSDFCFISENGQKIRDVKHEAPQRGVDLINGYDVGMSFMYTKALWEKTGPYWDKICEDYDWCVRAAQHTGFGLIQTVLAGFRVHGGQISGHRKKDEEEAAAACKSLARQLFGDRVEEVIRPFA